MTELIEKGKLAKIASYKLATLSSSQKNEALLAIAKALRENSDYIISENDIDIKRGIENNMSDGLLDRLRLNKDRIDAMAEGIEQIVSLPDPIGSVISAAVRPN